MNNRGILSHVWAVAGVLCLLAAPSWAQTTQNWAGGTQNWNADDLNTDNGTNWTPDGIPDSDFGDAANVGGGTAVVNSSVASVSGLTIGGTVDIQQGGSLEVAEDGETTVSGTLRLSGNGRFETPTFDSDGLLDLIGKDARFKTGGSFSQRGTLQFDVSAAGNATLDVGGSATLGGTLTPVFGDDVVLSFGDSFEFLKADSVTGTMTVAPAADAAPLPRGLSLQLVTTNNSAAVTVGNLAVLDVNRASGAMTILNPVGDPLDIAGYSIGSDGGLLNLDGWSSLSSQGVDGWVLANPFDTKVAELNLRNNSSLVAEADGVGIGALYNAALGVKPAQEDVTFEFTTTDGRVLAGLVEYSGPPNELVLRVDPESGQAVIRNLSTHIDPIDVAGYSILSPSGTLSTDWTSLQDSGAAGEGWTESNPRSDSLAELNLRNSQLFGGGENSVSLGKIRSEGADHPQDLVFEYINAAGDVLPGVVEYGEILTVVRTGDCNGDGALTAADLSCVRDIPARDAVLAALNTLPGDLDGNGQVNFPDFLKLAANFNTDLPAYTDGNVNLAGGIDFPDFLALAANFGKTPGAAAVPEPSSLVLLAMCWLLAPLRSRRRRR